MVAPRDSSPSRSGGREAMGEAGVVREDVLLGSGGLGGGWVLLPPWSRRGVDDIMGPTRQ